MYSAVIDTVYVGLTPLKNSLLLWTHLCCIIADTDSDTDSGYKERVVTMLVCNHYERGHPGYLPKMVCLSMKIMQGKCKTWTLDSWTGLWTEIWTRFWTDAQFNDDHFQETADATAS